MSIDSTVTRRMTMAREASLENRFVAIVLPWMVAAVAALIFLLTLNHWVSIASLLPVARTSGWLWQPSLTEPLYWIITYPFRWLPASIIPVALNLFSVVCACLSLALLTRSVVLLPHDRTKEQRIRESSPFSLLSVPASWFPPIVAAAVCGLQLSFWENATAASMEMFNLLLFAYVIRCLLEYRIDGRESWLLRGALVYGAAMANNWAMIGFFPVFITALIWIRGRSFLEGGFLGRMFFLGVAGLSLYLVLPAISSLGGLGDVGFWPALRSNLTNQKSYLMALVFNKDSLINGDRPLWVLGLPSLLPILALSIRWPSFMGDISKIGVTLANLAFHLIFGVLLVVCLWVSLDPQFSPRNYQPFLANYNIFLLSFYYLGALSIGYFVGYYLLVFGITPSGRQRFRKTYPPFINKSVVAVVCALAAITPILLFCRNLPRVRTTNGPQLRDFASLMTENLPAAGGIVLSDDPRRLLLVQSALTQAGRNRDYVLLDTASLEWPAYYSFLKRSNPGRWEVEPPKNIKHVATTDQQRVIFQLGRTNSVYYLHPSFGFYFELLCATPHGMIYKLDPYPTNTVIPPAPMPAVIDENNAFWAKAEDRALGRIVNSLSPAKPLNQDGPIDRLAQTAHLVNETNHDALVLGTFYSEALNSWGVQLQRLNQLPQAATHLSRALQLNPENVVAEVNLECNRNLLAGRKTSVQISKAIEDKFGHRTWDQIMRDNGPFDEPTFCFAQANAFLQGGNSHQAALQFERVRVLSPDNLGARLSLAQIYFVNRLPDEALKVIAEIHGRADAMGLNHTNEVQVLGLEASAHLFKGDLSSAESTVDAALRKSPEDSDLLSTATKVYMDFGLYTNALKVIDKQLKVRPGDPGALFYKGNACLQISAFSEAIAPLTRVLDLETNNFSKAHYLAQFMRAKAYLGLDKLAEAKQDYLTLSKALPTEFPVYYDLGEIAYREHDTNSAIQYYQLYKANAPTNFVEDLKVVDNRLAELKRSSP